LECGKGGAKSRMAPLKSPVRLIGPSTYKNTLDRWLSDPLVKIGEYNLMFLQSYQLKSSGFSS